MARLVAVGTRVRVATKYPPGIGDAVRSSGTEEAVLDLWSYAQKRANLCMDEATLSTILPFVLSFGVLVVYLCLPSRSYYYDGIAYAETIEASPRLGASLLHPNHLIYDILGYILFKGVVAFHLGIRAVDVLLITNSVLSAGGAYALFQILRHTGESLYLSSVSMLLFACSATWWEFSTDADPYISSVVVLIACFYLLLPGHRTRPIFVGFLHAIAMLLHQLAVFFYPVALLGLFLQSSGVTWRRRVGNWLQYSFTAFLLVSSAYCFGFWWKQGGFDFKALSRWITSHSSEARFSFDVRWNAFYTAQGQIRLFFGGRLSLVPINALTAISASLFLCSFFLLFLALARNRSEIRRPPAAPKCEEPLRTLIWLSATWVGVYSAFLFFWPPNNTYYRLFYFPGILILGGALCARYKIIPQRKRNYTALLLVAVVATYNFTLYIYPHSQIQTNEPLLTAIEMKPLWPENTVIYYEAYNTDDWTLKYFNPQTAWKKLEDPPDLEKDVRRVYDSGGTVWLETTAINLLMSEQRGWLCAHTRKASRHELINHRVRIQLFQIYP